MNGVKTRGKEWKMEITRIGWNYGKTNWAFIDRDWKLLRPGLYKKDKTIDVLDFPQIVKEVLEKAISGQAVISEVTINGRKIVNPTAKPWKSTNTKKNHPDDPNLNSKDYLTSLLNGVLKTQLIRAALKKWRRKSSREENRQLRDMLLNLRVGQTLTINQKSGEQREIVRRKKGLIEVRLHKRGSVIIPIDKTAVKVVFEGQSLVQHYHTVRAVLLNGKPVDNEIAIKLLEQSEKQEFNSDAAYWFKIDCAANQLKIIKPDEEVTKTLKNGVTITIKRNRSQFILEASINAKIVFKKFQRIAHIVAAILADDHYVKGHIWTLLCEVINSENHKVNPADVFIGDSKVEKTGDLHQKLYDGLVKNTNLLIEPLLNFVESSA